MTLRLRMAAIAGGAVTVVVVVIAVVVYLAVRSDLRGEVDRVLEEQEAPLTVATVASPSSAAVSTGLSIGGVTVSTGLPAAGGAAGSGLPARGVAVGSGESVLSAKATALTSAGVTLPGPGAAAAKAAAGKLQAAPAAAKVAAGRLQGAPVAVGQAITKGPPQPFAGAGGYIQFLAGDGGVVKSANEGSLPRIPPSPAALAIAARGTGRLLADAHVAGQHVRVLTVGVGPGGAIQLAQPLNEVDHELGNLVVILLVVGGAGVVAAALLGGIVARTALAPIARFTRRTEGLVASAAGTQRLDVGGRDELGRLARSFNRTLDELERSVAAQRQLVADASHELRTPITSLRANIQVLEQADRLGAAERGSLRRDVIAELDELTDLVGDLVELARGTALTAAADDVRLDEIIRAAVTRADRRAEGVRFSVDVEPTLVTGDARRIDRAIANLLDNAVKWSPPGGPVETTLRDGIVTVRDHGQGFADHDLPDVFARFYRADAARGKPGSGLGLAIVKQAAEAHGGQVAATNAPGGGACVTASFGPPTRLLQSADARLTPA
jgi:two-component system, OmpR family, sensor histidine kinase MprB